MRTGIARQAMDRRGVPGSAGTPATIVANGTPSRGGEKKRSFSALPATSRWRGAGDRERPHVRSSEREPQPSPDSPLAVAQLAAREHLPNEPPLSTTAGQQQEGTDPLGGPP